MKNDALDGYPTHKMKREAVERAILDLNRVSLNFWRFLEGPLQSDLHKQMLHLRVLREEVVTSASTLLEADAISVIHKAEADKALKDAALPAGGHEQEEVLEPHQSPILLRSGTLRLFNALKLGGTETDAQAWTRMSRDWKMLLYSVRCAQDCIYGALLIIQGQCSGVHASMATCLKMDKNGNPKSTGRMLEICAPGYREWFIWMKKTRDELKRGLAVASDWTDGEHTILLSEPYPNGVFVGKKNERRLSLDFAAECLCMCTAAINAVNSELAKISQRAQTDNQTYEK